MGSKSWCQMPVIGALVQLVQSSIVKLSDHEITEFLLRHKLYPRAKDPRTVENQGLRCDPCSSMQFLVEHLHVLLGLRLLERPRGAGTEALGFSSSLLCSSRFLQLAHGFAVLCQLFLQILDFDYGILVNMNCWILGSRILTHTYLLPTNPLAPTNHPTNQFRATMTTKRRTFLATCPGTSRARRLGRGVSADPFGVTLSTKVIHFGHDPR